MRKLATGLLLLAVLIPASAQEQSNPLIGRWDFNLVTPIGNRATWLAVTDKSGEVEVWYQPSGGNVYQVKDFKVTGSHLTATLSDNSSLDLNAHSSEIAGFQRSGGNSIALSGTRAPELKRSAPKAWTAPDPLFNGKDLSGWEPIGNAADSHWVVTDGLLINEAHGANLKSKRTFDDFKLHFEANCPNHANSGFYLRGRYEVQLEYEPLSSNPVDRRIGSIYGRIAPKVDLPRKPGEWDIFDVTLVGRVVTIVRNGVTTIDRQEIEGITGGALDANEGEPGPFYIQGDHTGGLKFRNITISEPKR